MKHSASLHIAIIMDGNGRWAVARGRPRTAGHLAGADAVRRTVEAARDLEVRTLTLFAFSSDNWQRPDREVKALMGLFRRYLTTEACRCAANGVRISVIGRRDRLPGVLVRTIEEAEAKTAAGRDFWLRIAVDYSGRDAILRAALRWRGTGTAEPSREVFSHLLADSPQAGPAPDVDLLIRTGGEKRLSDFLLWECAYAELVFTDRMWPDFGAADLAGAVREFQGRERRFGRVKPSPPAPLPQVGEGCRLEGFATSSGGRG
ncbi:MAG TPA: di-trans,poly-cis-decaprenylcistransferase [Thermoanaerobaculia bacterium]|nr:di-trans,poly-cis-decaprenylcistransferase [Thermoanaerobaculia bacterium]